MDGERRDLHALIRRHDRNWQLGQLGDVALGLAPQELTALLFIAERLAYGQEHFGPFKVHTDTRNFIREGLEEAADLSVYIAAQLVRIQAMPPYPLLPYYFASHHLGLRWL